MTTGFENLIYLKLGGSLITDKETPLTAKKDVIQKLKKMGHSVEEISGYGRSIFGRGQIILRDQESGVLWGGSDPRADGCAMSY